MQSARLVVTNTKTCYRENLELTCYGDHFTLIFWSGARKNKMVVQIVGKEIHVAVTEESWRMWFGKVVEKFWTSCKAGVVKIANKAVDMIKAIAPGVAIAGTIFKAIAM